MCLHYLPPCKRKGGITHHIQCNNINTSSHTRITSEDVIALNFISAQQRQNCPLLNSDLSLQTDLYSRSLLTQALTSREGSLASRLIQDRADMLQMELPSLTTRRLALVSFPVGGGRQKQRRPAVTHQPLSLSNRDTINSQRKT